jgi:hypothetical protein
MERQDEHSRAHPEPEPAAGAPGVTQPESTEHGATLPRADSTEQDAAGRYDGMPEEGPGAGDAARVYAEDDSNEPGTAQRRDRGGEGLVDKIRSALGQDERQDDRPGERQADWRDKPQAGQQAEREGHAQPSTSSVEGRTDAAAQDQDRTEERQPYAARPESSAGMAAPTADEAVTSRERTEAEAYGGARPAAPQAPGSAATTDADTSYDAAAERKAVGPADADTAPGDATTAERAADTTDQRSADETVGSTAQTSPGGVNLVEQTAVISGQDAQTFQARWETIQGTFIDDPHAATEQADALVGEVMDRLASLRQEYLRQLREALGDGSDTEAMRVALQRYRAFFQLLIG